MRRGLGAPVIDLDEADLDEILHWLERVKYRALYRECQELQELGLMVYSLNRKWVYKFTAGYMIREINHEQGEGYFYESYDGCPADNFQPRASNRKPGDKWRNRKPPGKPAREFEYVGTFRVVGSAINPEGNWETFLTEDIDINSIVPSHDERTALAESTGVNGE